MSPLVLHAVPVETAGAAAVAEAAGLADVDRALQLFLAHRSRLFRIAHRVTGDVTSAEDIVQEAWLRWQRTDRATIKNPAAFLTTATTHLAINLIQTARHRHEVPAEPPLADLLDATQDPAARVEQAAALEDSLGLMLARLTHSELAAYLLRKGFDYAYADLARLLRTSVPNTRQLVRRAQLRLDGGSDRPVERDELRLLTAVFLRAARTGDVAPLERLLSRDVPSPSACGGVRRPTVRRGHRPTARIA